jgi:hypothetical protein
LLKINIISASQDSPIHGSNSNLDQFFGPFMVINKPNTKHMADRYGWFRLVAKKDNLPNNFSKGTLKE